MSDWKIMTFDQLEEKHSRDELFACINGQAVPYDDKSDDHKWNDRIFTQDYEYGVCYKCANCQVSWLFDRKLAFGDDDPVCYYCKNRTRVTTLEHVGRARLYYR